MVGARCVKLQQGCILLKALLQLPATLGIWVTDFLWGRSLNLVFFWIPTCHLVWQTREAWQILIDSCLSDKNSLTSSCQGYKSAAWVWKEAILDHLWPCFSDFQSGLCMTGGMGSHPPVFPRCWPLPSHGHSPAEQRWTKQLWPLPLEGHDLGEMCFNKHTLVYIEKKKRVSSERRGEGTDMVWKFREIPFEWYKLHNNWNDL